MALANATVTPPPKRRGVVAVLVLIAGAVLALCLAHVHRRHLLVQLGYELSEETAELRKLEEENRRLRLERSMLRHPNRIERFAESLGMVQPDPSQIRVVRPPATPQVAEAPRP